MNKIEFENISAFHPGYYIKDLINDLEMAQFVLEKYVYYKFPNTTQLPP